MVVMESRRLFQSLFASAVIMLVATIAAATAADTKMETKLAVCPVSLTNPDGQALALEKYDLRVAVHGPLALTEMEMVFRNPQNRQMEGRFLYLLPTGATVSRFAKEVDGKLMEGEVVETQKARSVYREILHSMRDPALLEQDQGNRFSAKVFPIPANGTVRLVLGYSQVLPIKNNQRRIVVPLAGMPKIADFTFTGVVQYFSGESLGEDTAKYLSAQAMDGQFVRLSKHAHDFVPDRDIELTFVPAVDAPKINVIKAGNYEMVSYRADYAPSESANAKRDWVFYIDSSASGADMEARRTLALTQILQGLDEISAGQKASAFVFDVDVASLFANYELTAQRARAIDFAHLLKSRHCLGATDLGKTLKHIGETARSTREPARFVLVSDGIASWGKRELAEVLAELGEWPAQHVLHALVLGGKQDEKLLNALVARTHGRVVALGLGESLEASIGKTLSDLTEPLGQSFEFYDEGAAWIFPKTFRDVRSGTEMVAFCELKDGAKAKPGVVYPKGLGKVDLPIDAIPAETPAFAPLLMREAIAAQLAHLEKQELDEKDAKKIAESRKQRIELSVRNRVLCPPLTSLLVLETEADYVRFKIDRTSLADVLVVGEKGIEHKARKAADLALREVPKPERKPAAKAEEKAKKQAADKAGENAVLALEQLAKADDAMDGKELKDLAEEDGETSESMQEEDRRTGGGRRRAVLRGGGSRVEQGGQAGAAR
ncbi:MAG: hypothetical protein KIS92_08005, partial [Planctomycetota bacterium]|nr:hypothetical protein [Planctomycetota bacterium]